MIKRVKILCFMIVAVWAVTVWMAYFDLKSQSQPQPQSQNIPKNYRLSDRFWAWEAAGRLRLIDLVLDIDRQQDLNVIADQLMIAQNKAYGVDIDSPRLFFTPLKGEASGLYVPEGKVIFLNSKIEWNGLPIERFAEVVLHENMHHILTYSGIETIDFQYMARVGRNYREFAMDHHMLNPQESVAYRAQRAGRYIGLSHSDLSVWEVSAKTQEIRILKDKISLQGF